MVDGLTVTEPPDAGVTSPTPLSIKALVEPELVQLRVEEPPGAIGDALALNAPVGGGT